MPDDNRTEETVVTEQEPSVQGDAIDAGKGNQEALEGFNDPDDDEKPVKDKKAEKKPEEEAEKEDEGLKKDKKEVDEEEKEPEEEEEEDRDVKRGQEILDREAKRKEAEADAEAEQARADAEEAEKRKPEATPYTAADIRVFRNAVPDAVFPDEIEIDGENVNLKSFLEDAPEVKTISAIVAKNIVDTLLKNKYLVGPDDLDRLKGELLDKRFMDRVTDRTHGVPKAVEIYNSKEFKEWHGKQSDKIQALFISTEERDHIRGFKRFLKDSGLAKADEKTASLDKKRADSKKKVDAIYTTTARSKKSAAPMTSIGQSARDEAMAGFNEPDDES